MKKLLALLLMLSMLLPIIAMTGCAPTDPGDGPDNPGGDPGDTPNDTLEIIKDGVANYTLVYDNTMDTKVIQAVEKWKSTLALLDIAFTSVAGYNVNKIQDCEILIGSTFTGRDGYTLDPVPYGIEGYAIKVQDSKIMINGGSPDATIAALKLFFEEYIGCVATATTASLSNVSIAKTLLVEHRQQYDVTDVSVAGVSLNGAYIRANADGSENTAAQLLQAKIYSLSGIWLNIKKPQDASGNKIVVEKVAAGQAGPDGFRVFVSNGTLTIQCAYDNAFPIAMEKFLEKTLDTATAAYNYPATYSLSLRTNIVYYTDFGADSYGVDDAFEAMKAAHDFANISGQIVMADKNNNGKYYIGLHDESIQIKTNTDWGNAKITIDDRQLTKEKSEYNIAVFDIAPDVEPYTLNLANLRLDMAKFKKGSTNIGLKFPGTVMLHIEDENTQVYKRTGTGESNNMGELLVVDKDGNLDPDTPFIFNYDQLTKITVYTSFEAPITVKGGEFTTRANQIKSDTYWSVERGMIVRRANTTVYGVKHYVTDEPAPSSMGSCPYGGFYSVNGANNVTIENCLMTPHTTYKNASGGSNGSYDTGASKSNKVTWKNCTQTKDICDRTYWGVFASNFSKNLTLDGCTFSRFDAHRGLHNVTIKNSEIGYMQVLLVGSGTALIENSVIHGDHLITLRDDYGATWEGDIIVKDCVLRATKNFLASEDVSIIQANWLSHDFGYKCYLPNVYIDGLECYNLDGTKINKDQIYLFRKFNEYYLSRNDSSSENYYDGNIFAERDGNVININQYFAPEEWSTKNFEFKDWVSGVVYDFTSVLNSINKTRQ